MLRSCIACNKFSTTIIRDRCRICYGRARRRGEIQTRPMKTRSVSDRFWDLVSKDGPVIRPDLGQCWIWIGQPNFWGYGVFATGPRGRTVAHRMSWILTHGLIPEDIFVLHKCDNRRCVRPDHLFLGTRADNAADMRSKDRQARGSRTAGARLTEDAVRHIRAHAKDRRSDFVAFAEEFGVHPDTIRFVVRRKTWRHV
jgi:hypothetical protein